MKIGGDRADNAAARELFYKQRYEFAKLQDIAAAAGVTLRRPLATGAIRRNRHLLAAL